MCGCQVRDEYEQGDGLAEGDRDDQCGGTRTTAIISEAIWPTDGERIVHGNVSFTPRTFCAPPTSPPRPAPASRWSTATGLHRMLIADERHLATI